MKYEDRPEPTYKERKIREGLVKEGWKIMNDFFSEPY
jgi:hypothetical protein